VAVFSVVYAGFVFCVGQKPPMAEKSRVAKRGSRQKRLPRMSQARRKRHAIARVSRQDVLEKMNALITERLFFGLETSAPVVALVPSSSALTLLRFRFSEKTGVPMKL
jgi:hypothetical protein